MTEELVGTVVLNRKALEGTLATIRFYQALVESAIVDLYDTPSLRPYAVEVVRDVCNALEHILQNEFRSDENRGGS